MLKQQYLINKKVQIEQQLSVLVNLSLSITRRAAGMRVFHFGDIRPYEKGGTVGQYALHIQCPWRIESATKIITGHTDLYEPVQDNINDDAWNYDDYDNLQDTAIRAFFGGYDEQTRSAVRIQDPFIVEKVDADMYGGVRIQFTGDHCLVLFPSGSRGEEWRFFAPGAKQPHFIVDEKPLPRNRSIPR